MQLGATPTPRRATLEDVSSAIYEVTTHASNELLQALSHTPLWPAVMKASEDQLWWFRRTQHLLASAKRDNPNLVGELTSRVGDWHGAYNSLSDQGFKFTVRQKYNNPLIIPLLLEVGADPSIDTLLSMTDSARPQEYALLLAHPGVDVARQGQDAIDVLATYGRVDLLALLLADSRVTPGNEAVLYAAEQGQTEAVQLLLEDGRLDPSGEGNVPLQMAAKYGFADIVALLLADKRVIAEEALNLTNYRLDEAVIGSHADVVALILERPDANPDWVFDLACKVSSFEVVQLLFADKRVDPSWNNNEALRVARARKRANVIELLLSDERVRRMNERMHD